jgi:hypothetical protein
MKKGGITSINIDQLIWDDRTQTTKGWVELKELEKNGLLDIYNNNKVLENLVFIKDKSFTHSDVSMTEE